MDPNLVELLKLLVTTIAGIISPILLARYTVKKAVDKAKEQRKAGTLSAPPINKQKIWRETVFSLRGFAIAGFGALLATGLVLGVQWILANTVPRIEVNWLDKPFTDKSLIQSPVPVFSEIKIAGRAHGKGYGQYVWVFLCNSITEECALRSLTIFPNGDWEDSIKIGDHSQACSSFSAQFALVDGEGEKILRATLPKSILRNDLPMDHILDKDVFVVQLVNDEDNCSSGGTAT